MSTIVQNINSLVEIKQELREILIDNYKDPGDVFLDYPQYFYDLFNVMEDKIDNTNEGYSPDYQVVTETPPPIITYINRYIYITHPWAGADIYFSVDNSIYNPYTTNFPIPHDMTYVKAYAVYNRIKSEDAKAYIPLADNLYPKEPVLNREDGIMTITTETTGGSIYYEIIVDEVSSDYILYTGPFQVYDYQTIGAYTTYTGNASNEVFDYASGEIPSAPENPTFSRSENIIYISCETDDAIIYYKIGDGEWTLYTNVGVEIPEDTTITISAKSSIQGIDSETVSQTYSYIAPTTAPATPIISFNNNTITITCGTAGAQIQYQYSGDGDSWSIYSGLITISETKTIRTRSYKDSLYSNESEWVTCTYTAPVEAPADPVISQDRNTITITCSTVGATIYYRLGTSGNYTVYSQAIEIQGDTTVFAYSSKDGVNSNIVNRECEFDPVDYSLEYLTFKVIDGEGWIYFGKYTYSQDDKTIQYSKDNGATWKNLVSGHSTNAVSQGDTIIFKGTNNSYGTGENYYYYLIGYGDLADSIHYSIEGNIMSLIYGDNFIGQTVLPSDYIFYKFFDINHGGTDRKLVSIKNIVLPATTLTQYCYSYMFNLRANPTYTNEPITFEPPKLPATNLAKGCYKGMFYGCGITSAPKLPATTLAENCYEEMFDGCAFLTSAPDLTVNTLNTKCYYYMFYNCSNLQNIKCLATDISATNCLDNWVVGVSSNGTFIKNSSMTSWPTGNSGIPSGWTVQNATS